MQKSSIDIFSANKICVRPICRTNFEYLTVQQIAVFFAEYMFKLCYLLRYNSK